MGSLGESMQDLLARVATSLGIKDSEARRLEKVIDRLAAEKQRYADKIDDLKDEIERLEAQALKKKKRMDAARGESKRIIGREIEQILVERKSLREREGLLFNRQRKVILLLSKFELASHATELEKQSLPEDLPDEAMDLMEDLIAEEKSSDKVHDQLEKRRYEEPKRAPEVDVAAELAGITGESEADTGLSKEFMDELDALEDPEAE